MVVNGEAVALLWAMSPEPDAHDAFFVRAMRSLASQLSSSILLGQLIQEARAGEMIIEDVMPRAVAAQLKKQVNLQLRQQQGAADRSRSAGRYGSFGGGALQQPPQPQGAWPAPMLGTLAPPMQFTMPHPSSAQVLLPSSHVLMSSHPSLYAMETRSTVACATTPGAAIHEADSSACANIVSGGFAGPFGTGPEPANQALDGAAAAVAGAIQRNSDNAAASFDAVPHAGVRWPEQRKSALGSFSPAPSAGSGPDPKTPKWALTFDVAETPAATPLASGTPSTPGHLDGWSGMAAAGLLGGGRAERIKSLTEAAAAAGPHFATRSATPSQFPSGATTPAAAQLHQPPHAPLYEPPGLAGASAAPSHLARAVQAAAAAASSLGVNTPRYGPRVALPSPGTPVDRLAANSCPSPVAVSPTGSSAACTPVAAGHSQPIHTLHRPWGGSPSPTSQPSTSAAGDAAAPQRTRAATPSGPGQHWGLAGGPGASLASSSSELGGPRGGAPPPRASPRSQNDALVPTGSAGSTSYHGDGYTGSFMLHTAPPRTGVLRGYASIDLSASAQPVGPPHHHHTHHHTHNHHHSGRHHAHAPVSGGGGGGAQQPAPALQQPLPQLHLPRDELVYKQWHAGVSVLFADIVSYTSMSQELEPEQVCGALCMGHIGGAGAQLPGVSDVRACARRLWCSACPPAVAAVPHAPSCARALPHHRAACVHARR